MFLQAILVLTHVLHVLKIVALRLVMRQVVLLVTLEIRHVVLTEDSSIAELRLAMLVMLLVLLAVVHLPATV